MVGQQHQRRTLGELDRGDPGPHRLDSKDHTTAQDLGEVPKGPRPHPGWACTGETGERGLRLLEVKAGDTLFVDGGAGGVGAATVQMALARGAKVIASAGEANHDYLREIGATPVR